MTNKYPLLPKIMFHTYQLGQSELLYKKLVLWLANEYVTYTTGNINWQEPNGIFEFLSKFRQSLGLMRPPKEVFDTLNYVTVIY